MSRYNLNSSNSVNAFRSNGNFGRIDSRDEFSRSHGSRSRILAIMRLACKVLGMKKRSIGRLSGGGVAVTALLLSMGIGAAGAQAQVIGGSGASVNGPSTTAAGDRKSVV